MSHNSFTSQSLGIFFWNTNGFQSHEYELVKTLHEKQIDIALIIETYFTPDCKFSIPGHKLISSSHPDNTAHEVSAFLIKSSLLFNICPIINEDFLKVLIITIEINHIKYQYL